MPAQRINLATVFSQQATPSAIAGPRDLQDMAHHDHRELVPVVANEGEFQACSLAKKAVACFRISQGGRVVGDRPGPRPRTPKRRTQYCMVLGATPRLVATSFPAPPAR